MAELGAAFPCGRRGLSAAHRPDNPGYIASWLKVLTKDLDLTASIRGASC